jgi:class 3 adenylate cyclase
MDALGQSAEGFRTNSVLAEILSSAAVSTGPPLPVGTVTLLLADLGGSLRSSESDREAMARAAVRLDQLASDISARHRGVRPVEQVEGDGFVLAFARASDALGCALDLQRAIAAEAWPGGLALRVRMALHTGDLELRDGGNAAGPTVNRCARLRGLGHGGQTLLSQATYDVVVDRLPEAVTLRDLGNHRLRDLSRPERVFSSATPSFATTSHRFARSTHSRTTCRSSSRRLSGGRAR